MTTALPKTTVKFVQLSPATTTLLVQRLVAQRDDLPMELFSFKQTVATFHMQPGAVMALLDDLIKEEIPGTGPQGKQVKLLRELRRRLRDALNGMDAEHSKVQIVTETPSDPLREKLLDIFVELWDGGDEKSWGEAQELTELVVQEKADIFYHPTRDEVRAWLDEHL